MIAVEARGVRKEYGGLAAVEDLTFAIQSGEILGVLGPNGAGKTTAIRVLTTILAPTRGTFEVAGVTHTHAAEIRQRIGVLPESAGYPERQTGEEYLRYHARLYGHSVDSARASTDSLLREVGLHERRRSLIDTYSRGMKQRLGIARALVNSPEVVFLDEPTLGLDPAGQRQMLALVRLIAEQRGATVLLSTHLLAEVEESCARVLILNKGRVVVEGTVAEVAQRAAAPRFARVRVPAELLDDAVAALSQAGIGAASAELEGARLSDAFLAMTEDD
jgi:ABC-2 type transport system ATP-binding protein